MPDYRPGIDKTWWLDINGEADPTTGVVRWTLRTLDPETGLPPSDPLAGFLPPENGTGRGQGHVSFSIRSRSDLTRGTQIANSADIIFDTNEVISTEPWLNVIGRGTQTYMPIVMR